MSEQKTMTVEEKSELFSKAQEFMRNGDEDKAYELFRIIPLAPFLAEAMKDIYGVDYLKKEGFNLIEVEAKYGKEWFNK